MTNNTFEGVVVNIPVGTTLTASRGAFLFKSALTENYYTCKKVKYLGDGCWDCHLHYGWIRRVLSRHLPLLSAVWSPGFAACL